MKHRLLYVTLSVVIAWFGGFVCFAHYINSYEIDKTTKTDAIIVLTGGKKQNIRRYQAVKRKLGG